jgi:hypothetical protein
VLDGRRVDGDDVDAVAGELVRKGIDVLAENGRGRLAARLRCELLAGGQRDERGLGNFP